MAEFLTEAEARAYAKENGGTVERVGVVFTVAEPDDDWSPPVEPDSDSGSNDERPHATDVQGSDMTHEIHGS